jgi:predicted Zn-ribbon and HTH transcriptional regulator
MRDRGLRDMARIKIRTHEVTNNFCGSCGVIMSKTLDIFDHCPKCKEIIEA